MGVTPRCLYIQEARGAEKARSALHVHVHVCGYMLSHCRCCTHVEGSTSDVMRYICMAPTCHLLTILGLNVQGGSSAVMYLEAFVDYGNHSLSHTAAGHVSQAIAV